METINKMYLTYADVICKIYGCNLFDLYTNDQGQSIARSIPDTIKIDQRCDPDDYIEDRIQSKPKTKKRKKSYSDSTPTPNSLVSETPRGKKCTAEEESNQ